MARGSDVMILLVIVLIIVWILALLLWLNERKQRKAEMEILKDEIKREIHWTKFYKVDDTRKAETEAYMRVLKIIRELNDD